MVRKFTLLLLAACLSLAAGCVYRVNIQQGNYLERKNVDQITVGMTRSQVRFLLGTPMVADEFHPERWDYVYYFKDGKTQKIEHLQFVVYFADEKVVRTERPLGEIVDPKLHPLPRA